MPVTPYTTNGIPADNVGVQGDVAFDFPNGVFYGPKLATTWVGTASNLRGATGLPSPTASLSAMTNFASTYGPQAQFNGQSLTANVLTQALTPGTTQLNSFTPVYSSALTGFQAVNYGATGAALSVYLMDMSNNTQVIPAVGLANGSINQFRYTTTQYPLIAGRTYAWYVQRSGTGAVYVQINPIYLTPSAAPSCTTIYGTNVLNNASIANLSSQVFNPAGMPAGYTSYISNASPMYLQYIQFYMSGSGTAQPFIYNDTAAVNFFNSSQTGLLATYSLTSTPTLYQLGPFAPNQYPFVANSRYYLSMYAPSGALTVTSAVAHMYVGQ